MSTEICTLKERYEASMVLSGAGDALGYNHGYWQFQSNGEFIHRQVKEKGGLAKQDVKDFPLSDDIIMHLATAEVLIEVEAKDKTTLPDLRRELVKQYEKASSSAYNYNMPFNPRGRGCGAAMRAMCIGLRFPDPEQERHLVAASIESGRLTHHHPTGYLGALAAALFTAYAVRGSPPVEAWGHGLMEVLEKAMDYIIEAGHCVEENVQEWVYFKESWENYLTKRGILDGKAEKARFPECYGVKERDEFYRETAFYSETYPTERGIPDRKAEKARFPECYGVNERKEFYRETAFYSTGGASGHDAPMIAYDALLCAGHSWEKLADHGFFHGGDSVSTAVIAAAWWGAIYGFRGVPERNYKRLEYRERLVTVAEKLFELRNKPFNGDELKHA